MRILTVLAAILALEMQAWGFTASEAFAGAPNSLFPLLEPNTRLDMIDYYTSGSSTASTNRLNGKSRITTLTPLKADIEMTDASSYSLFLLPAGSDTVVGLISTVATPTPDSRLNLFNRQWADITAKGFKAPVLDDWYTDEGKKHTDEVETMVPFLLTSYSYNPATGMLTITNTTEKFLSSDLYDTVRPYLRSSLAYKWDGKKFNPQK